MDILEKICGIVGMLFLLAIFWLIGSSIYGAHVQKKDGMDFMQFAQQNHCYIFEYDQRPDGTVQKRWSCQNDIGNQDDSAPDEE